jgi:uroporphyrinogen III methyltransferase/synthase
VLPEGLRDGGWEVDVVEAYRTVQGTPTPDEAAAAAGADVVTFTSSSTVRNFLAVAEAVPPIVASIGPITSQTARDHGLEVTIEASEHTIDGLLAALTAHFSTT